MTQSTLETTFLYYWQLLSNKPDDLIAEYRFDRTRRWRFDFVLSPDIVKLAIELEGGIWSRGRHSRGKGYLADMNKYNAAMEQGWTILRYTTNHLEDNPQAVIDQIQRTYKMLIYRGSER